MQAIELAAGRRSRIEVGPLDTTRDFIDVRDVAAALALLAERGEPGTTYNVASGTETQTSEVLTEGLRVAGLRADVPIDRRRRLARRSDIPRHVADIRRLCALGFRPVHSLATSMDAVVGYYRGEVASAEEDETDPARTLTVTATATQPLRGRSAGRIVEGGTRSARDSVSRRASGDADGPTRSRAVRRAAPRWFALHRHERRRRLHRRRRAGEVSREPRAAHRRAPSRALRPPRGARQSGWRRRHRHRGLRRRDLHARRRVRQRPDDALAQHDAAVGGKVAVNTSAAKKLRRRVPSPLRRLFGSGDAGDSRGSPHRRRDRRGDQGCHLRR